MNEKHCRALVRTRAEGLCERCCGPGHTFHHRKNRSAGGKWDCANIVLLCGDGVRLCHGWVTVNPLKGSEAGWHVRPWNAPADTPVLWRGNRWVLLMEDGSMIDV